MCHSEVALASAASIQSSVNGSNLFLFHRRAIHERFHFMDKQFRALEFDSVATTEEVTLLVATTTTQTKTTFPRTFVIHLFVCLLPLRNAM